MTDTPRLSTGAPAPDFLLRDPQGHPHALSHYRGRVVVLNFWSATCPWSERADGEIAGMMARWGANVAWISIAPNANETVDQIRAAADKRGLPLVLLDPERAVTELYGAEMTPHLFVLDAGGRLHYQGAFNDITFRQPEASRNYLQEAVGALLAGEEPALDAAPAYGCTIVYYPEG